MTEKPPERAGIEIATSWPFVSIEKSPETAGSHKSAFILMSLTTLAVFVSPAPTALSAVTGFVAGYAFNNWASFDLMYQTANEEDSD